MATLTAEKRTDAIEDSRVCRSSLADSYPCPKCCGDGHLTEYCGDVEIRHDCDECHGDGADPVAVYRQLVDRAAAKLQNTLAQKHSLPRGHASIGWMVISELKNLLARAIAGEDVERELMKQLGA